MPEPTLRTDALVRLLAMTAPEQLDRLRDRHPETRFSEGRELGAGDAGAASAATREAILDLVMTSLKQYVPAAEQAAMIMRARLDRAAKLRATGATLTVLASGGTFGSLLASLVIAPAMALLALIASLIVVVGEYLDYSFHDRSIQPAAIIEQLLHGVAKAQQVRMDLEIARVSDESIERVADTVRRANAVAEELGVLIKKSGCAVSS